MTSTAPSKQEKKEITERRQSINKTARTFGISKAYLPDVAKEAKDSGEQYIHCPNIGHRRIFTEKQEDLLVCYLNTASNMRNGLTKKQARELAFQYATANSVCPLKWTTNRIASLEWLGGFIKRNRNLTVSFYRRREEQGTIENISVCNPQPSASQSSPFQQELTLESIEPFLESGARSELHRSNSKVASDIITHSLKTDEIGGRSTIAKTNVKGKKIKMNIQNLNKELIIKEDESDVSSVTSVDISSSDDETIQSRHCTVCNKQSKSKENWCQCRVCSKWAHQLCGMTGQHNFFCHKCF